MNFLIAALHTLGVRVQDHLDDARTTLRDNREQGSVTIEQVLWAVAVIAFVGIVVTAITTYVTNKSKNIK
ncbi:hypothetical protein [Allobranchiibius sp. CTAmp26]|uniref:hypothetical protein n=1 Tax=Allobranchiibius sp. CTAmp26 TaxID=2815214 RepID=UPI001AA13DFF|nr:hypothetical protein [Allobranchiibius sp. CTAmp26]MBO1756465.1 hypothetical protein [Allobranchiibius sp. CTAmp26]